MKQKYIETLGALPSPTDVRDYVASCVANHGAFPTEFELEHPDIKNQGNVNSCVAHSLAAVIEYYNRVQEETNVKMSTGFIYGNRTNTDYKGYGMYVREALDNIRKYGTVPAKLMPDNVEVPTAIEQFEAKCVSLIADAYKNHITSYYRLADDNAMKASLIQGNPIVFSMPWRSGNYVSAKDGVLIYNENEEISGYHCMYIYGWNESGWKVANSWGTWWGIKGCFVLPYGAYRNETWGVEDDYSESRSAKIIADLKAQITELNDTVRTILEERDILVAKIAALELQLETDETEQCRKMIDELKEELKAKDKELKEANDKLGDAERQNELLRQRLLDIDKPYDGTFGQLFAKIVNWICKIIEKIKGNAK